MSTAPSTWRSTHLGDVADIIGGGTPSRSTPAYFGRDIDWVTPSDLPPIGEVRLLGAVAEGLSAQGLANSSAVRVPAGSVLFSSRATIGKIAVTDRECATNQGFANFVPKRDKLDPWFLAYLLENITPRIHDLCGETTYKEVSRGKLRTLSVQLPDVPSQQRIVARIRAMLAKLDEARVLHSEALDEVAALPTAVCEAISVAREWPKHPVEYVILDSQNGRSIKTNSVEATGHVLTLSAVRDVYLDVAHRKPVPLEASIAGQFAYSAGDVFVSRSNTRALVGLSAVAKHDSPRQVIYPDLLIRLSPNLERIDPVYLAFALRFPQSRAQIRAAAQGTSQSMVKISGASLRKVLIPVPPLETQRRLVEQFDAAWSSASSLRDELQQVSFIQLTRRTIGSVFPDAT